MSLSIYKLEICSEGKYADQYRHKSCAYVCAENEREARDIAAKELGTVAIPEEVVKERGHPGSPWRNTECSSCEQVFDSGLDGELRGFIKQEFFKQ